MLERECTLRQVTQVIGCDRTGARAARTLRKFTQLREATAKGEVHNEELLAVYLLPDFNPRAAD